MANKIVISKTDFLAYLDFIGACGGATEFVRDYQSEDAEDIYSNCTRSGWLETLLVQLGLNGYEVWEKAINKADNKFPDWFDRDEAEEKAHDKYTCDLIRKAVPWSKVLKALTK